MATETVEIKGKYEGKITHRIPGECWYDGVMLKHGMFEPDVVARVSDDLQLHPTDVFIAAYPKSGQP